MEAFVEGKMTEEEFERDSEVEAEAEGDEAAGMEEVEESGRTETSAMEVDEGGERGRGSRGRAVEWGTEAGAVVVTKTVAEEGPCRYCDANDDRESGEDGEYGECGDWV